MESVFRQKWPVLLLTIGLYPAFTVGVRADDNLDSSLRSISPSQLQQPAGNDNRQRPALASKASADADALGLEQAVRLAVDWHPRIGEAIGTLFQQGEGVNVAESGYYPQVTGGIKGGYTSGYGIDAGS